MLNASDGGAPLPISYGGAQGTDMDSLLGGGDIQQQLQSAISATLLQMLFSQIVPPFMQLAQQLLSNGQNGGSQTPQQGSSSTPGVTRRPRRSKPASNRQPARRKAPRPPPALPAACICLSR
ncbi:Uncharacterised protein [Serratia rubidaea]|uniref:Uncharacterized protein n=1 Tax=Serratia rubidaea TaxID=61652 RepID=A0A4V6JIL8_SERRU|nr:Uncharacterised protein [Serratia rubidaea]